MFDWNDFMNDFPYTNFSDINVSWFLNKFKQVFDEWQGLYTSLQEWKTATDAYNEQWRQEQEQAFAQWENNFQSAIDAWKVQTENDINTWEQDTITNLESWKNVFITEYNALKAQVEQIAIDAENAKNSAQASAESAQASANSASATAESLSASLTQIDTNTNDISDLKTQLIYPTSGKVSVTQGYYAFADGKAVNSPSWCKVDFLFRNAILTTNTLRMYLLAYNAIDGAFVGGWNGSEFTTTYTASASMYKINIAEWLSNYPNYKFRVDFYQNPTLTPADVYSNLTVASNTDKKISSVNNAIDNINDGLGYKKITPIETVNNYGLQPNGNARYSTLHNALKYSVNPGDKIIIHSPQPYNGNFSSWQFQSAPAISELNHDNLIGESYVNETFAVIEVPENAYYVIISALKTDTVSGLYEYSDIVDIVGELNPSSLIPGWSKGTFTATGTINPSYNGALSPLITAKSTVKINPNARAAIGFYDADKHYIGKVAANGTINQTGGDWKYFTGEINFDISTYAPNDAVYFIMALAPTDSATITDDNLITWVSEHCKVTYNRFSEIEANLHEINSDTDKLNETVFKTGSDITKLNSNVPRLIDNGKKLLKNKTVVPFALLHFSDIHGNGTNLQRVVDFKDFLGDKIDDAFCSGDMVTNKYSDGMAFWNNVNGADEILMCIGNHDVTDGNDYNSYSGVTPTEAYNQYFAPYISNWNVTHAGDTTYYYKDYAAKSIRMIVLDYLLTGADETAQNTWLQGVLTAAKTAGFTVVIIEHSPLRNTQIMPCGFSMIGHNPSYARFPEIYQATVQDFIDGGGKFACYLSGHSHSDFIGYNTNYPNQLCVTVTCAVMNGTDNDQLRETGNKSRDAFNIVLIDTTTETIKLIRVGADIDCYLRGRNVLTVSYTGKNIIADY